MGSDLRDRVDAALRVTAALLGTSPLAVLASVCLARFLPLDENARFTAGIALAAPIWVTAICVACLARRAWRAWAGCLLLTAAFAALAYGVSP